MIAPPQRRVAKRASVLRLHWLAGLSERQERILGAMHRYRRRFAGWPTLRELMRLCDIPTTSTVHYQLRSLAGRDLLMPLDGQYQPARAARINYARVGFATVGGETRIYEAKGP